MTDKELQNAKDRINDELCLLDTSTMFKPENAEELEKTFNYISKLKLLLEEQKRRENFKVD